MLKFNKSVYEWLCENKWKETTRKINNKVGTERVCVSLIPSLASIWFRMYLVLSIGGVTVTPPPSSHPMSYCVWPTLTKSRIVNTFRLGNLSLLIASRSSVRFPYSPYSFSSSSWGFSFFLFFLWLFAFLSLSVCFSRKFAATATPGTEQQDQPRNGYQFLSFFSKKKKTKINDFLECLISDKFWAKVLSVKYEYIARFWYACMDLKIFRKNTKCV